MGSMIQLGIQIIPTMPVDEVIDTALAAEEAGYDYCLLADEGFMPDVYIALGAIAQRTARLKLGPVTNGYTRHPAVTANALATLDELSRGRALAVLVAGGSMVLNPMGIERDTPLTVMRESLEIMRRLWSGQAITWQGRRYRLQQAQLTSQRAHTIPIWLAVRGDKMLELAGQQADGVVLVAKSDVGPALQLVALGEQAGQRRCLRIYMDRIAYTPELLAEASALYAYVLMDSPPRMLAGLGISQDEIERIRSAMEQGGPAAAARLVRPEMVQRYQIAGAPHECSHVLGGMIAQYGLDVLITNITTSGLAANRRMLAEVAEIARRAGA